LILLDLSENTSPQLVFIVQTGSKKSKDVQTQIRKHVMRDIGKSRRKEKRGRKINSEIPFDAPSHPKNNPVSPGTWSTDHQRKDGIDLPLKMPYISLDAPDPSYRSIPDVENTPTPLPHLQGDLHDILSPAIGWHETKAFTPGIDRLWHGCMDPLVPSPVELNDRTRELADLGKQISINFVAGCF